MVLPPGVTAKLAGVPRCADGPAAAGSCAEASRLGTAVVMAGAGSTPFPLKGGVYLTGPYKGAPFGLAVAVPAVAGPYDLGTVVVRQALHIDPDDAHVTVVSDPLPTIVKGVPVRLRSVNVDVDRPGFTLNATSCDTKQIKGTLFSEQGSSAQVTSRFQVGDCAALAFKPRLGLRLTGTRQTKTGRHPGVKAVLRQAGIGEAGIRRAVVQLPKSLALDPDNVERLCEFEDGAKPDLEEHCPKGSIVGRAKAVTPLLDKPLAGNIYFVKNVRTDKRTGNQIRTLPTLVVALRGEIAINLRGLSTTTASGRLVNKFVAAPDAPIKRFDLNIGGGSNGILTITRTAKSRINLCAKPKSHIANVEMSGHNGKRRDFGVRIKTPCAIDRQRRATRGQGRKRA